MLAYTCREAGSTGALESSFYFYVGVCVCVCVCAPGAFCSSEGDARLDCEDAGSVSFGGLLLLLFFASVRYIILL